VRQQIEQEVAAVRNERQPEVEPAREPSRQEEQQPMQQTGGQQPMQQTGGQQPMQQTEGQAVQVASTETEGPQGVQRLQPGFFRTLLHQTRDLVEQQAEQQLRSVLDRLFSDSVRTTLQHQSEQTLRLWLQAGLGAMLSDAARRDLQQEAERTLEPVLQDAFDALFAGPVRAAVQWHGERVIEALLRGDVEAAGQHAEQALHSSLHGTGAVLQHHLEQVVPLLLNVFLRAVQQALGSLLKENLGPIATARPGRAQETGLAARERVAGTTETPPLGGDQSQDDLQEHLTEGLPSAAKDGAQET
jgi:hypothetical protein